MREREAEVMSDAHEEDPLALKMAGARSQDLGQLPEAQNGKEAGVP